MRSLARFSFIVAACAALALASPTAASSQSASPSVAQKPTPARPTPMVSFAQIVERVLPAVVSIGVTGEAFVPATLHPDEPLPEPKKRAFRSGGSGVIVNAELGIIATNNHVVRDAVSIVIGLHDGREAPATLIGVDSGTDIAVLKINLKDLTSIPFGNSSHLRVGDIVLAIGNPFGLEGSATSGIVSGLMRSGIGYDIYESFIQIDAAVNPGNSGGALVNLDGELIGINTAVGRQGNSAVGIAFAIPINMARRVGMEIHKHGRMRRGSLGFETRDVPADVATKLNLPSRRGAMISRVAPGSPAERADIRPGCIILAVDGTPVRNSTDFAAHFGGAAVGDELEFQILRPEGPKTFRLTVTDQLGEPPAISVSQDIRGLGGLTVSSISPRSPLYGQVRGVLVTNVDPGGPAHAAGLRPDDVILSVNELTVSEASEITDLTQVMTVIQRARISRRGAPYIVEFNR